MGAGGRSRRENGFTPRPRRRKKPHYTADDKAVSLKTGEQAHCLERLLDAILSDPGKLWVSYSRGPESTPGQSPTAEMGNTRSTSG